MLVIKFGGSSLASSENIRKVKSILAQKKAPFLVVVSALGGATDQLQQIANLAVKRSPNYLTVLNDLKERHFDLTKDLMALEHQANVLISIQKQFNAVQSLCEGIFALRELSDRTLAKVMGFGEQLSAFVIGEYLKQENIALELVNSLDYIKAKGNYLKGELLSEMTTQLMATLSQKGCYIAPGFIASNPEGELVLLGRGGSDYTAAIFAAQLGAKSLEIWSDVNGMLTANPKLVRNAATIKELTYQEAFELSHFGAKVLYGPTIRPVMNENIPIRLKNTFSPQENGTYISSHSKGSNKNKIKGISSIAGLSLITVSGVGLAGAQGMAKRVFVALEEAQTNVILITQCCSEQNICIAVRELDQDQALVKLNNAFSYEINQGLVDPVTAASNYSVIALVGNEMKRQVGLAAKAFGALGENGVNIVAIAQGASERNISLVVQTVDEKKAINVLHERFFSTVRKKVHLFVAGVGNVGTQFLNILAAQQAILKTEHNIEIRLVGLANSKKMVLDNEGIALDQSKKRLSTGQDLDSFASFVQEMNALNLRNSIFIDNTASQMVSDYYPVILRESISIATCNKIACSDVYAKYDRLKSLAKQYNCSFNYETTVGAALPVIKTIQNLVLSGDKIHKIQAVLSGSLNFIFNHYNGEESFANIVRKAKEEGYTEPNPLIDLSGIDVMRKILILAREAAYSLNMEDVSVQSFIPENCLNASSAQDLFEALEASENYFQELYAAASSKGNKLKVVASFEAGKAQVGLLEIDPQSPLFHLEGKDNIVSINSKRYPTEPLVIKGAGAGAELTAAGVFSDLMLMLNH